MNWINSQGSKAVEGSGQVKRSAAASWTAPPRSRGWLHKPTNRLIARARRHKTCTSRRALLSHSANSASLSVRSTSHSTKMRASGSPSPRVSASLSRISLSKGLASNRPPLVRPDGNAQRRHRAGRAPPLTSDRERIGKGGLIASVSLRSNTNREYRSQLPLFAWFTLTVL